MSERILAVAPQLNLDGISRSAGDLVFTSHRVFFVKTTGKLDVVSLLGIAAREVAQHRSRKASRALQESSIEDVIAASDPDNRWEYGALDRIKVKRRRIAKSVILIYPQEGKKRKFWGSRKNVTQVEASMGVLASAGAPVDATAN
jgi:hypothetical protein